MNQQEQLEIIITGRIGQAVRQYLDGDWSRLPSPFTIPRATFDKWADSVELPYGRVFKNRSIADGVYVLSDLEGWLVFEQVKGAAMPGGRIYVTYKQAKRAALALGLLSVLRGAS